MSSEVPPVVLVLAAEGGLPLRVATEMSLGGARVFCGVARAVAESDVASTAAHAGAAVETVLLDPERPAAATLVVMTLAQQVGRLDLVVAPSDVPADAVDMIKSRLSLRGPCRFVRLDDDGALVAFHHQLHRRAAA